jgi:hypothetical protein
LAQAQQVQASTLITDGNELLSGIESGTYNVAIITSVRLPNCIVGSISASPVKTLVPERHACLPEVPE